MNKLLFLGIFVLIGIIYFIAGYLVSRKVKSVSDYFLAGRELNFFRVAILLIGTQLGGGFLLGTSKEAYLTGYYGLLYVVGVCIGFFILSLGIAGRLRLLNVSTTAELFETHYQSSTLKKIASLCSIISLIGILSAQIIGSRALLISLDLFNPFLFVLFWMAIIIYAMLGGLKAIVQNDIFQLSCIIVLFTSLFVFDSVLGVAGNFSIFNSAYTINNTMCLDYISLLMIAVIPALYALIEQDLAQVFFAAKNSAIAIRASFAAALFLISFAIIPMYFGIKAKAVGIIIDKTGSPLISYVSANYPSIVVMLVTYGILAAIISSANAVLCAISSNIVSDFLCVGKSKYNKLIISQITMICVGIAGLFFAFQFTDLIKLLVDSYAVPVTGLLVSLLVVYCNPEGKNLCALAAFISVVAGLSAFVVFSFLPSCVLLHATLDAIVISTLGYCIGLLIDRYFCKKLLNKNN